VKKVVSLSVIREKTGFNRSTVLRWKKGLTQPDKETARILIRLYKEHDLVINDEIYALDFNGCYDKTVEVPDDYLMSLSGSSVK